MNHFLRMICLIVLTTSCLNSAQSSHAQEQSTEHVPKEAFAAVLVNIDSFKNSTGSEFIPHEIITAVGKRDYGIDPADIQSAKIIIGLNEERPGAGPLVGGIIEFKRATKIGGQLEEAGPSTVVDGTEIYFDRNLQMHVVQPSPKTLLFASSEPFAVVMAASKNVRNPFTRLLANSKSKKNVQVIASVEKLKGVLTELLANAPVPPPFGAVNRLPEQIKSIDITASLGAGLDMEIDLVAYGDDEAKKVEKTIKQLLSMAKAAGLAGIASQTDSDDIVQQAQYNYVSRIADKLEKDLTPTRDGDTVTISFKNDVATVGVLMGLLLPAVQSAREAARRAQASNNLKQVMLGFHNYHDIRRRFPGQAITDKEGKKLLSWRVEILPYVGQPELYRQFKKDEPWDSEHNKKLLNSMPDVFRNPNSAEISATNILAVTGKGTAFDGKTGKKFSEFRDGTSNTIMFVEANKYVPWTKPEEFEVDWDDPLSGLGGVRPGIFQAGFADGSTRAIANSVDAELLKSLFRINDGQ